MGPSILTKPFPLVSDLFFVIALLVLAGAIGDRILRILGISQKELTTPERVALCSALGLGILQYVFLILGALHVLSSASVALTLLALLVLFGTGIVTSGVRYARGLQLAHWELTAKVLAVAIVVVLGIALILAATPVTDPDGVGYHVAALKWWMEAQTLIALPTYIHTYCAHGWRDGDGTGVRHLERYISKGDPLGVWGSDAGGSLRSRQPADQPHWGTGSGGALSRLCLPAILVGLHRSGCRSLRGDRVFGLGSLAPKQ